MVLQRKQNQEYSSVCHEKNWNDDFSDNSDDDLHNGDVTEETYLFPCPLDIHSLFPSLNSRKNTKKDSCEEVGSTSTDIGQNSSKTTTSETKVSFAKGDNLCTVYTIEWEDRKGPWEKLGRDQERFQRRIKDAEVILKPVLTSEKRNSILRTYTHL